MNSDAVKEAARARAREISAEYAGRGDATGWFDELYREAAGDIDKVSWADLEPNKYFAEWANDVGLAGSGKKALVIGCGLGDDARFLYDRGFEVTAFDISRAAIEWAKRLHSDTEIRFEVMDLFEPFRGWLRAFDFVLEVYTIQPLPVEMRDRAIDAVAALVKPGGELVVVTHAREDDEGLPDEVPWPMSRAELARFAEHHLVEKDFRVFAREEDEPDRWVVVYEKEG